MSAPSLPRRLLRAAQGLAAAGGGGPGGVTVLAYHLVGAGTGGPVDLDLADFRRHLDELGRLARVVPLAAAGSPDGAGADPRPRVAITFDDAYANFFATAWPLLAERGFPATLFVPVGFVEGTHPAPIRGTEGLPAAAWSDLAPATAGGRLEIGSHSWSHPDLRRLSDAALDRELGGARGRLEDRLGVPVRSFCYPRGLWDRRVERRVAAVYDRATVGGGRRWAPPQSPWRIQRISLRRDGPRSIAPLLAAPVWIEEWAADRVRRLRPGGGGRR